MTVDGLSTDIEVRHWRREAEKATKLARALASMFRGERDARLKAEAALAWAMTAKVIRGK